MSNNPAASDAPVLPPRRLKPLRVILIAIGIAVVVWLLLAYSVLPRMWRRYEKHHPALADAPRITHTADGIPGDPLNVALVGTEKDLHLAMIAAKWYPADPITLRSSLRIAAGSVFHLPYDDAPVSSLFLFGRKQDLAFEQPIGDDPRKRHHVRFWRCEKVDDQGRPLWIGAATKDIRVGLSRTEGEITHHISPEVDPERNKIIDDLRRAGDLAGVDWIDQFQDPPEGRNGGGDPWRTDGRLAVGVLELARPLPGEDSQRESRASGQQASQD